MKRVYLTGVAALAMFFTVNSATAQVANENQTATEQRTQHEDFRVIQEQDLPNEVRQALQRDYAGATVSEAYVKEKDGEVKYKLAVETPEGEAAELYADPQGNWIEKEEKTDQ